VSSVFIRSGFLFLKSPVLFFAILGLTRRVEPKFRTMMYPLLISPLEIFLAAVLVLVFFVAALVLMVRKETGTAFFLWFVLVLFMPVFGPICYLIYFVSKYGVKEAERVKG
jgi:hypothetical protein